MTLYLLKCMHPNPRGRGVIHPRAGAVHGRNIGASAVPVSPLEFRLVYDVKWLQPHHPAAFCATCRVWTEFVPIWSCELKVA